MTFLDLFSIKKIRYDTLDFIDEAFSYIKTTDEGRITDLKLTLIEKTLEESSARSVSRRILAWTVIITFISIILLAIIGTILKAIWVPKILKILELIYSSFLMIISFYFVSNIISSSIDKVKEK